eukprot:CAMPEP_0114334646 /NCGR_PEP_ID=MMETSP0101-20121206/4524_1 /TAXON_ID=38822 ORGANISM="Pteridomonas danica, Strain PT" /NCGR_SAMPLE_ID=MMETSP0101 /ASSEMBLY_ACC=CAM_ASM_000211 /LENGTH=37 /DNA_ID= /DNA_START= /DNA_END= /DNA_ORIENTATION=
MVHIGEIVRALETNLSNEDTCKDKIMAILEMVLYHGE